MSLESKIASSQDVALAAGVSRTVVSWVVNGTAAQHRVTKSTEQRVKAAVAQLNYEPGRFLGRTELLSCSADKLLSESPVCLPEALFTATQQLSNLTTLLSAAG
jgi:hypothetical protein